MYPWQAEKDGQRMIFSRSGCCGTTKRRRPTSKRPTSHIEQTDVPNRTDRRPKPAQHSTHHTAHRTVCMDYVETAHGEETKSCVAQVLLQTFANTYDTGDVGIRLRTSYFTPSTVGTVASRASPLASSDTYHICNRTFGIKL